MLETVVRLVEWDEASDEELGFWIIDMWGVAQDSDDDAVREGARRMYAYTMGRGSLSEFNSGFRMMRNACR